MRTERDVPPARRHRLPAWLFAAQAAAVLLAGCALEKVSYPETARPCGKHNREAATQAYLDALNRNDREQVKAVTEGNGPELETAIDVRMRAFGGRGIVVDRVRFADTVPYVDMAHLTGKMTGGVYQEAVPLARRASGWCVSIHGRPVLTEVYYPANYPTSTPLVIPPPSSTR
ncbi:hypothetical protein N8J89_38880 [Crossiella sp. CA-258035]|uniref:hypothetical protein n=1 Tax=Crossiella sp. CA-258035 TaxID=2981138 RepID=UPI0024BD329B|nr:hypothetical protein [Crossiella sp. CA-258035]WHT18997.1 hypothetical protein N8J89_38880 [Crossiella sp. CA-258035]